MHSDNKVASSHPMVRRSNGLVALIRAEKHRVLFGFWRGKRLRDIEGRLRERGKCRWPQSSCARTRKSARVLCGASSELPRRVQRDTWQPHGHLAPK